MNRKTKRRNKAIALLMALMFCTTMVTPFVTEVLAEAVPSAQPTEEPAEESTQQLTEESVGQSIEEPTQQLAQELTETPTEAPTEEPTEEPTEAPTQEPTTKPTEEPTEEPTGEPTQEPTEEPTEEPMQKPTAAPTQEPTQEPTEVPTEEPTAAPTQEPTGEPTQEPTEQPKPTPIVPVGKYKIEIAAPETWQKDKATVKVRISDQNGTGWTHIKIVLAAPSAWTTIVDGDEQDKEYDVTIRENSTLYVSITDRAGNVQVKSEAVTCFDSAAPTVRAGISGELICIEASDLVSGVEAVFINGHRLTYKGDVLDAKVRDYADDKEKIAVQAVDKAGNFSTTIYLKNPFYGQPQEEAKPTAAPKRTKKPSSGGGGSKATPRPTATPEPSPTATPAPVSTGLPFATTAPTVSMPVMSADTIAEIAERVLESMIKEPSSGSAFSMDGNMKTLDLLYSKATNKQFIGVQTKKGQTYYIVIDYDKPIDAEGDQYETYFLNLVDDYDLLAVLDEKENATPVPTATPAPTLAPTPTPTPRPTATPEPVEKGESVSAMAGMLLMLVMLIGGGAVAFVLLKKKDKSGKVPDIDDLDFDDDDEDADGDKDGK